MPHQSGRRHRRFVACNSRPKNEEGMRSLIQPDRAATTIFAKNLSKDRTALASEVIRAVPRHSDAIGYP